MQTDLFASEGVSAPAAPTTPTNPAPQNRATLPSLSPSLVALLVDITRDLELRADSLLQLNPSRREALALYFEKLSHHRYKKTQLKDWLAHDRTDDQTQTLRTYFEEVALITLGQTLVLKHWAELGIRKNSHDYISKLNWELSSALKTHLPLQREGWHITRPNLYSWYAPNENLRLQITQVLESMPLLSETPQLISDLVLGARRYAQSTPELDGYDDRFYNMIGRFLSDSTLKQFQLPPTRTKQIFTSHLRFGQTLKTTPPEFRWVGFEENTFPLLIAELCELWSGPKAPPLWSVGNSLDAHPREQMSFSQPSIKTCATQILSELESCEAAFVAEATPTTLHHYKTQLDALPWFKKFRAPKTHLGTLQAAVALTKLRPGGILLWTRETPLTQDEGQEVLANLLGRAQLLAECDLSGIEHSLPTRQSLFSKYIYVFRREVDFERRLSHRPYRIRIEGQIRSHIEVPLFLDDVLEATQLGLTPKTRPNWKFHMHLSPLCQRDWIQHWPDPAETQALKMLEVITANTQPLAHFGTIRKPNEETKVALLITQSTSSAERKLEVSLHQNEAIQSTSNCFAFYPSQETSLHAVARFLESDRVRLWLDYHAERKSDRWVLSEALLKLIPVPQELGLFLQRPTTSEDQLTSQTWAKNPKHAAETLAPLKSQSPWALFYALAIAYQTLDISQSRLKPMMKINENEKLVDWSKLMSLFRPEDCQSLTLHTGVTLMGQIPSHTPIVKMERSKTIAHGILLWSESNSCLKIQCSHKLLSDMIWDQMHTWQHPTWSEIVDWVKLPRKLEVAESAANDILNTYEDWDQKLKFTKLNLNELSQSGLR